MKRLLLIFKWNDQLVSCKILFFLCNILLTFGTTGPIDLYFTLLEWQLLTSSCFIVEQGIVPTRNSIQSYQYRYLHLSLATGGFILKIWFSVRRRAHHKCDVYLMNDGGKKEESSCLKLGNLMLFKNTGCIPIVLFESITQGTLAGEPGFD